MVNNSLKWKKNVGRKNNVKTLISSDQGQAHKPTKIVFYKSDFHKIKSNPNYTEAIACRALQ
jgi:hypothetical protein